MLVRETRALPHVHPHRMALGARDGTVSIEANPGSGSNRLLADGDGAGSVPVETVPLCRLDTLGAELGLDAIALLKTNCEGHDLAVLQGATSLLRAGQIASV